MREETLAGAATLGAEGCDSPFLPVGTAIRGCRNVGVVCKRSARVLPVFRKLKATVEVLTWEAVGLMKMPYCLKIYL